MNTIFYFIESQVLLKAVPVVIYPFKVSSRVHTYKSSDREKEYAFLVCCPIRGLRAWYFGPNTEYSPCIPDCGRNQPRVRSCGGGVMLKTVKETRGLLPCYTEQNYKRSTFVFASIFHELNSRSFLKGPFLSNIVQKSV